jgi:hypothetical protein
VITFDRTVKLGTAYRTTVDQVSSDTVQQPHAYPFGLRQSMEQGSRTVAVGHIPGTSARDLPRTGENRRDLNRRLDRVHGTFAMLRETPAQDPAYRSSL